MSGPPTCSPRAARGLPPGLLPWPDGGDGDDGAAAACTASAAPPPPLLPPCPVGEAGAKRCRYDGDAVEAAGEAGAAPGARLKMMWGLRGAGPPMGDPGEGPVPYGAVGASGWSWWARRWASGGGVGVVVLMGFNCSGWVGGGERRKSQECGWRARCWDLEA